MTTPREPDNEPTIDATVKMPRPSNPEPEIEDIDPEQTLVREDWESAVIRRVAPHVAAVQDEVNDDEEGEGRFGWESEGLRRLSRVVQQL
jgi:hypothetical protein